MYAQLSHISLQTGGHFCLIEQELIRSGFENQLRLSKRKLEKSLIDKKFLESVLHQEIQDVFVDWDFENDTGFVIFILKPKKIIWWKCLDNRAKT